MEKPIISCDPGKLSVHPLTKAMPEWGAEDERFLALVEDIRARGVDQPLLIDGEERIVDGRHRWRAALQVRLPEVACKVIDDAEIASAILHSLIQRRHFTKSALAYLAYPLLEEAHEEAVQRKLNSLKNSNKSSSSMESTTTKTVEEFARSFGFGRDLFYQARELHEKFKKDPRLKYEYEAIILNGELGLGTFLASLVDSIATAVPRKPRFLSERFVLVESAFETLTKRFAYWEEFDTDQRSELAPMIRRTVAKMPVDLRKEFQKAIREVAKESKAAAAAQNPA
ncbi:MAG: hypothetical protein JWQ71_4468 [Pedosphaera sp.]|nr:hypothetical protein [Pedosphaera sp.]